MPILSPKQLGKVYKQIAHVKPRLLGVDVGTLNMGIALSDPSLRMAIPLTVLNRKDCSYFPCSLFIGCLKGPENPLVKILKENRVFAMVCALLRNEV